MAKRQLKNLSRRQTPPVAKGFKRIYSKEFIEIGNVGVSQYLKEVIEDAVAYNTMESVLPIFNTIMEKIGREAGTEKLVGFAYTKSDTSHFRYPVFNVKRRIISPSAVRFDYQESLFYIDVPEDVEELNNENNVLFRVVGKAGDISFMKGVLEVPKDFDIYAAYLPTRQIVELYYEAMNKLSSDNYLKVMEIIQSHFPGEQPEYKVVC